MFLDKNLRLPGSGWWARFINGGVTWLIFTLFLVSAGIAFAANGGALLALPSPALLAAHIIASVFYFYFIGGLAMIGVYGARRNLREWRTEEDTLQLRLRRGFYWMFLAGFTAFGVGSSTLVLALLWSVRTSSVPSWALTPTLFWLSVLTILFLFLSMSLLMATYLPWRRIPRIGPDH